MAIKHEGVVGRTDIYKINPEHIKVVEGWNPRSSFGDELDQELKESIVENGVLVPLRVKRTQDNEFELVDGERRLRAVRLAVEEGAEIAFVPCIVERKAISQTEALFVSLLTNEGKRLAPSEEGEAYQRLVNWGISAEKIAKRVGKSIGTIYNRLKLVDGSEELKNAVDNKDVSIQDAKKIVENSDGDIQKQEEHLEEAKRQKQERKSQPKRSKKSIDVEDMQDIISEKMEEYKSSKDETTKQYYMGYVQALALVLDVDDPFVESSEEIPESDLVDEE